MTISPRDAHYPYQPLARPARTGADHRLPLTSRGPVWGADRSSARSPASSDSRSPARLPNLSSPVSQAGHAPGPSPFEAAAATSKAAAGSCCLAAGGVLPAAAARCQGGRRPLRRRGTVSVADGTSGRGHAWRLGENGPVRLLHCEGGVTVGTV